MQHLWGYQQWVGIILPLEVPTAPHPVLNTGLFLDLGTATLGHSEHASASLGQLSFLSPAINLWWAEAYLQGH